MSQVKKQQTRRKVEPAKTESLHASSRRLRECLDGLERDEKQLAAMKDAIIAEGDSIRSHIAESQRIFEAMAAIGAAPDEWVPASLLGRVWVRRETISRWVSAGELEGRYLHRKLHVRPHDFFAVQRSKLSTEPPVTALNQQ